MTVRARNAATKDGWVDWFGFWFFTDLTRMDEHDRPTYFYGTARDLCLSQGIAFEGHNEEETASCLQAA